QNYALVFEGAEVADGVFIGPGAQLANDRFPRAITPDVNQINPTTYGFISEFTWGNNGRIPVN
ncbi:MAG: hypothetical protein ACXVJB_12730, partial [Mucilaginibacter sp.]